MGATASLSSRLIRLLTHKKLRPLFLLGLAALIITQIVALSPSRLEDSTGRSDAAIEPETLVSEDQAVLAPGIPKNRVPEYTVENFNDATSQGSVKQWNIVAQKAFLYNTEKLVHAKEVRAMLFDPNGQATVITGKEAKYFLNQRDLEVFGDVHTTFPDGFEIQSEYLRYRPNDRTIQIPALYPVIGRGTESDESGKPGSAKPGSPKKIVSFTSRGLDFAMGKSEIVLQNDVFFRVDDPPTDEKTADYTTIESDHCVIHRDRQLAYFTMNPERRLSERFVKIAQPTMRASGRRATLNYGDFSEMLHYLSVNEDVTIRELGDTDKARWGTGGKADFDTKRNVIVLSEYPQVYQGDDTITGDIVILHRDTDVVEVENSNAFSKGSTEDSKPKHP